MPGNNRTRSTVAQPNIMTRSCGWISLFPKKRIIPCLLSLLVMVFTITLITTATWQKNASDHTKIEQPAKEPNERLKNSSDQNEIQQPANAQNESQKNSSDHTETEQPAKEPNERQQNPSDQNEIQQSANDQTETQLIREKNMEESIASIKSKLDFLKSQYRGRQEDLLNLHSKIATGRGANRIISLRKALRGNTTTMFRPEVIALLKNMSGTHTAAGIHTRNLQQLRTPFVYQLLPHLMNDPYSLKPAYHMKGRRNFSDIVFGIPTVKRDKESYLMITLLNLIAGMSKAETDTVLIVVMIGETDLEYIINTAKQIETMFEKQVEQGLIEVISPSPSYYPDFESLPSTLGDSHKRVKWRTKQNLDTIYLMAYAQSKGTFYLMLEDDIVAKKNYVSQIKQFAAATSVINPNWFYIEFCHVGGIGKLFRTADLTNFITYVQLFYKNMPIDWLLESYLADRVCTIDKNSKTCAEEKLKIRPKFMASLFQHIGLYSSLKGKIQKIKDSKFGTVPSYYPHSNPPLKSIKTDIEEHLDHTVKRAYEGQTFFWGVKPKNGNFIEFWFEKPIIIERYLFRSGNAEHVSDKFYDTIVEVLRLSRSSDTDFTVVGSFDEFGIADGELKLEPIVAIRLRVNSNSFNWAILSEIELKEKQQLVDS